MSKSNSNDRFRIGISLGDPAGIGYEVTIKALQQLPKNFLESMSFVLIGSKFCQNLYSDLALPDTLDWCEQSAIEHPDLTHCQPGQPHVSGGLSAFSSLQYAVHLLKSKAIDGLVTAPLSKQYVHSVESSFQGHTEFLADAFGVDHVDMMFVSDEIKSVILTRHIPLHAVPDAITSELIEKTLRLTVETLQKWFDIKKPRVAVCGLNPHAGEDGLMGTEEKIIIQPVIKTLQKKLSSDVQISGPLPADTVFTFHQREKYDVILAMYHDQGLIPVKTLSFAALTNLTIGLPIIRTSPAHGTAFNIAGQNRADCSSMSHAIQLCGQLLKSRSVLNHES